MIRPNWEIFRAKFSENLQRNFEWLCYLLFCKEFNQLHGIFRYKNQSAIETNPIKVGNEVIGWQARFYDTPLSNHKDDFTNSLEKAKRDYSDITKVLFYTNQEWGQTNKGKEPQGLKDIKIKAKNLRIKIEWKAASYFESEFVTLKNKVFSKHFFSFEKSFFDLIIEQQKHTENILNQIQTSISYNNQDFEINRDDQLKKLKNDSRQISILSGNGGVGKTVLIKNLYEQLKVNIPFYAFKATEFELRNINDLFKEISFQEFSISHKDEKNKIIVIDSAEKLLDINNTDPFKEFLSVLIEEKWKIIFTTRDNYLEDLNYQFFEIYNIAPLNIRINNLELKELNTISNEQSFSLPGDEKILELIRNPFYLNEYLKINKDKEELKYSEFKNKLWNKSIKKTKSEREQCFLKVAFERSNSGQFYINPICDSNVLNNELVRDGILGYELAGYFITHDIYEEWALEKIIEIEFIKKSSNYEFFLKIGQSLPIRRCFRNWLSEKLLLNDDDIKSFIEEVIDNKDIESFWKDEVVVSILLSNYSKTFFHIFKDELLSNELVLLKKLTFILRIACKEVDRDFSQQLGVKDLNLFSLRYILTRPKGQGWECLIRFVFDNMERIGIKNINFVLPVIHDWNSKFKKGETTRLSGLIALQFYQWILTKDVYCYHDKAKDNTIQTILYGSSEIKDELEKVFKNILTNKWKNDGDPYYDLSKVIVTSFEGIDVSEVLPEYVLKIAELFWSHTPKKDNELHYSRVEVEQCFGVESSHHDYHPASAYQTPIYWLLQLYPKGTIKFILNFTNKSVRTYASSSFDKSVCEIKVFFNDKTEKNQYISRCLWGMYRGNSSPVSPYLLQSIHMSLEKFLLENGKEFESNILENWLLYLLKNSESASISAVVTSIVLAYPEKTFNVAEVLFRSKKFILNDTIRCATEQDAKSLYTVGLEMGIGQANKFYDDERIKTCEDKHRKCSLENLILNYQFFRNEGTSESEAEKRQKIIWGILDNYYRELPSESEQSESDKTWRISLARMDRRKMNITSEKTDEGIAIQLNPEVEPDLKKYSEESLAKSAEPMKYISLKRWSDLKFKNDEKYKEYEKYENDPLLALQETKEILDKLGKIKTPEIFKMQLSHEDGFFLFNYSVPAYVCAVLIKNNLQELSLEEKTFCKNIVLDSAFSSLNPNYRYQISDGVHPAISVLPSLLDTFPEEIEKIKLILLLNMFNEYRVDGMLSNERFSIFPIMAIRQLWENRFDDAQSLLLGYFLLKPKYNDMVREIQEKHYKQSNYSPYNKEVSKKNRNKQTDYLRTLLEKFWRKSVFKNYSKDRRSNPDSPLLMRFLDDNEGDLQNVLNNKLSLLILGDFERYDLSTLNTVFRMIPQKADSDDHRAIAKLIISAFAKKLTLDDRENEIEYHVKHGFLRSYAYFVLNSPKDEIRDYLQPFLNHFNASESIADLFQEFVLAEDRLNAYDNFWLVWNTFKEKIFQICEDGDKHRHVEKIVKSYLFSQAPWKETAKEWHSLRDDNRRFFKEISRKIGHCTSTLYAISELLDGIGSNYIDDGVIWISDILRNNQVLANEKLEVNTIYYIENLARKYTFNNREKIKKTKTRKDNLLVILDYLIEQGSVIGYMLRESVV